MENKRTIPENEKETITANELMDQQYLPRTAVVNHMLPAGTYILAGTPKIGKSFLMTQLCWCVSEGEPFLGFPTKKSTVLYLALEDTRERLQSRLDQMFGVDWNGEQFHLMFHTDCQGVDLVDKLRDFIFFHPDTRLIVIDTLQRVRESSGAVYSYGNDYREITLFKELTDVYDVALVLVHHTRKNTEDDNAFNQISGTNGLLGAADGAFLLHKDKEKLLLEQTGRDMPSQRYVLKFDSEQCRWEMLEFTDTASPKRAEHLHLMNIIDQIVGDKWIGTSSELLELVCQIDKDIKYKPNTLSRKLNCLTWDLKEDKGIVFWKDNRTSKIRGIQLLRLPQNDDNDANDDKNPSEEIPSLSS
jgi:hypothetical protein